MSTVTLRCGDVLEELKQLPDDSVDAIITDPPYNLSFMGQRWDSKGAPKQFQNWCGEWGVECLRVLRQGGYMVVFGGTRTFHRVASGLEDAGFVIRDCLSWNYGTGFPKSHNVSKAIDKLGGDSSYLTHMAHSLKQARKARNMSLSDCDQLFCDGSTNWSWLEGRRKAIHVPTPAQIERICAEWPELEPVFNEFNKQGELQGYRTHARGGGKDYAKSVGSKAEERTEEVFDFGTSESKRWEGYGTGLKPAWEPIILAQKPFKGTYATNVLNEGVGALNIDACRITVFDVERYENNRRGFHERMKDESARPYEGGWKPNTVQVGENKGRWPANAVFQHHPECDMVGQKKVKGSIRKPTGKPLLSPNDESRAVQWNANSVKDTTVRGHGDAEGNELIEVWVCHEDCPAQILDSQSGITKSAGGKRGSTKGWILSGSESRREVSANVGGLGDTGGASRFFYCPKTAKKEKTCDGVLENNHPTVKPVSLIEWLVSLSCPSAEAMGRTPVILDCFIGSGSTAIAAYRKGADCIGIDSNEGYLKIAEERLTNDWRLTGNEKSPTIQRVE